MDAIRISLFPKRMQEVLTKSEESLPYYEYVLWMFDLIDQEGMLDFYLTKNLERAENQYTRGEVVDAVKRINRAIKKLGLSRRAQSPESEIYATEYVLMANTVVNAWPKVKARLERAEVLLRESRTALRADSPDWEDVYNGIDAYFDETKPATEKPVLSPLKINITKEQRDYIVGVRRWLIDSAKNIEKIVGPYIATCKKDLQVQEEEKP